jgi:hypothetical protein
MHDVPVPGHPLAHTGARTTRLWARTMMMRCRSTQRWHAPIVPLRRPLRIHGPTRDSRESTVVSLQTSCTCNTGTCVTFVVYYMSELRNESNPSHALQESAQVPSYALYEHAQLTQLERQTGQVPGVGT